jgi:predicted nuclease with TOPRIM domain
MQTQIVFYIEQTQRMNKELEAKAEKLINQERGYSTLHERHKALQKSHDDLKAELDSHAKGLESRKKEAETKSVMLMAKH